MSKKEFLNKLKRELNNLPSSERDKTLAYYDELIEDRKEAGATEEAAVDAMGDIQYIASDIIADAKERGVQLKKHGRTAGWAILTILLIAVCIAALALCAWAVMTKVFNIDFASDAGEWVQQTNVYSASDFSDVDIDVSSYKVFVGSSLDERAHLEYYENNKVKFDVRIEGGTLRIKQKKVFSFFSFNGRDERQLQLLLPESFDGRLVTDCTSGEIRIDNIRTSKQISVDMTSGTAVIYDIEADSLLTDLTSGKLIIGRSEFKNNVVLDCTSGNIEADHIGCASMGAHTTSGRIELNSIKTGSAVIEATSGNIVVESFDSFDTRIDLTSGSVTGSLVGNINDYTIESHVTSGRNSLPGNFAGGSRKIYAEITSGALNLSFED